MSMLQSQYHTLDLSQPVIAGVLNCTPDSFSDGGRFTSTQEAVTYGLKLESDGASWLDIGGESSGPNSKDVSLEEELQRVIPVIEGIRKYSKVWISIDTYKKEVAKQALSAGADAINDVTALRREPCLVETIAEANSVVVIMFSKEHDARTTTKEKHYHDVIFEIKDFFQERIAWLEGHGVKRSKIILDPGLGFFISAKASYSFEVIRRLDELLELQQPFMLGVSRKSFLSKVWEQYPLAVHERESPSLVAAMIGLMNGAKIIRMHNVKEAKLALCTLQYLTTKSDENSF